MKRKKLTIVAVCIILIACSLICLNRSFKPIREKSDDGEWKVCYSKLWFIDIWSGYLFYTGNTSGDVGTITINVKGPDWESGDSECQPVNYYKHANWNEIIACGLQRKMTYFFSDLGGRPKNYTIIITWQKDGKKKTSVIKVE